MRMGLRFAVTFAASLTAGAASPGAVTCYKRLPPDGIVPTEFCMDGDLPQAGRDRLIWTLGQRTGATFMDVVSARSAWCGNAA